MLTRLLSLRKLSILCRRRYLDGLAAGCYFGFCFGAQLGDRLEMRDQVVEDMDGGGRLGLLAQGNFSPCYFGLRLIL